jgi:endonuclease/exonuclease/phosphatase family metal-dependent hydrolase
MAGNYMRILSLNLATSWKTSRKSRMLRVRHFIEDTGVDAVLFQEGLQVCWPAYSSLHDLCPNGYFSYHRGYIGVPWFYSWRVGVLSRFPIISAASLGCEVPQTEWVDAIPYPGRKRAVSVTVDVPGLGRVSIVSVHLTSSPKTEGDREQQLIKLVRWLPTLPESDVQICGGDWNTDRNNAAFRLTMGVEGITGQAPDYICVRGAQIVKASTVFTDRVVSDHVGIIAEAEK